MAQPVSGLNPTILKWARERSGYSLEQAAELIDKKPETVLEWEGGTGAPTYVQLEKLAYKIYKRPLALFFFPEPPEEPGPAQEFRTLPDFEIDDLQPDTRLKVRQALALQISLSELANGANPSERVITRDMEIDPERSPAIAAQEVREYLQVSPAGQTSWKTMDEALKTWRSAVEDGGVFVFKDTFKQREVSGFSLLDDEFPLIYVNNSTSKSRQIFTILHELAHLLVNTGGMTLRDDSFIGALPGNDRRIEVFCNAFAAHVLVPQSDFKKQDLTTEDDNILQLARRYKVSREVILRRLLEMDLVSQKTYAKKVARWAQDYFANAPDDGGGNYYLNQAAYLSDRYMEMAFGRYYQGRLSLEELAGYLNIRASNVAGLEQLVVERFR
jgi:Zn-dependent peptidase ImmA (M78 family)/transcriptional regulator with XRE-family HTH domain